MSIQVIERAVRIMRVVAQCGPASLTAIATRSCLPLPTAGRIVQSLTDNGILQRLENRKYQLGARLLPLVVPLEPFRKILQTAHPFIKELARKTNEDCGLAVLQGNEAVVVDWCYGPQAPRIIEPFAREIPLHCTFGVVLIAFQKADWRRRFLHKASLKKLTVETVCDRDTLIDRIAQVRRQGFYISFAENVDGAASVAVPVFDRLSRLLGALFVTAPIDRFGARQI